MDTRHKKTAESILQRVLSGKYYYIDGFRVYLRDGFICAGRPGVYFDAPYDVVLDCIIWALDNGKCIEELDE